MSLNFSLIAFQINTKIWQKSLELFMMQKYVSKNLTGYLWSKGIICQIDLLATGKFTLNPNPKPSACLNLPVAKMIRQWFPLTKKIISQIFTYKFLFPPKVQLILAPSLCQIDISSHLKFFIFYFFLFYTLLTGKIKELILVRYVSKVLQGCYYGDKTKIFLCIRRARRFDGHVLFFDWKFRFKFSTPPQCNAIKIK